MTFEEWYESWKLEKIIWPLCSDDLGLAFENGSKCSSNTPKNEGYIHKCFIAWYHEEWQPTSQYGITEEDMRNAFKAGGQTH